MSKIYLPQYTSIGWLQYNLRTGECEEDISLRGTFSPEKASYGKYDVVSEHIVGFYGSPKGPVFFCDRQRFPVYDRTYTSEIQRTKPGVLHTFILMKDNIQELSISYEPNEPQLNGLLYETEEDIDFLAWLDTLLKETRFYERYTKDLPTE